MTVAEEYSNRVKVAIEEGFVIDVETQIFLSGLVGIFNMQATISDQLSRIILILEDIHRDIPS